MGNRVNDDVFIKRGKETYHAHYRIDDNYMVVTSGFWRVSAPVSSNCRDALAKKLLRQMAEQGHAQVLRVH